MKKTTIASVLAFSSIVASSNAALWVDFNSNQDAGGTPVPGDPADPSTSVHLEAGYSAYHARHEVAADFSTATYNTTFSQTGAATVGFTPSWPNTTDNRVQQSIDRGAGNDANYTNPGAYGIDLVTDWIGIDTRTGNGGNGNWDGTTGVPTWIDFTFTGLPAGTYNWLSIHHDTENVHADFEVFLDTGVGLASIGMGYQSDSTPGGNPTSGAETPGPASTFGTTFVATGVDDVVIRFEPRAAGAVHNQLFAINGFQLDQVPEPSTGLLGLFGAALLAFRRRR